jgi:hypothetical protein
MKIQARLIFLLKLVEPFLAVVSVLELNIIGLAQMAIIKKALRLRKQKLQIPISLIHQQSNKIKRKNH